MKLWQRYFLKELAKLFFLFLGCFYFLYILIDYSTHAKALHQHCLSLVEGLTYYLYQFTKQAEVLIPVALMIATIKVLTVANLRHELIALTTGGISFKQITLPFLASGLVCLLLLYANFQFLYPLATKQIHAFEEHYFKQTRGESKRPVHALVLNDHTLLLYQDYHSKQKAFFDVFWLKSFDELYRMRWLCLTPKGPYGLAVDLLKRSSEGEIRKCASYEKLSLAQLSFAEEALSKPETSSLLPSTLSDPPRFQALSQLAHNLKAMQVPLGIGRMKDRAAETATFFYFRLTVPLACLFAVVGPLPFCLRSCRTLPVLRIYAFSLAAFIFFFTCVHATVILGESQVFPPLLVVLFPPLGVTLWLALQYRKIGNN